MWKLLGYLVVVFWSYLGPPNSHIKKKSKNCQKSPKIGPDHPSLLSTHVGRYVGHAYAECWIWPNLQNNSTDLRKACLESVRVLAICMLRNAPHQWIGVRVILGNFRGFGTKTEVLNFSWERSGPIFSPFIPPRRDLSIRALRSPQSQFSIFQIPPSPFLLNSLSSSEPIKLPIH